MFKETKGEALVPLIVPADEGLISQTKEVARGSAPERGYGKFWPASQTGFGPLTVPDGMGIGITCWFLTADEVQPWAVL